MDIYLLYMYSTRESLRKPEADARQTYWTSRSMQRSASYTRSTVWIAYQYHLRGAKHLQKKMERTCDCHIDGVERPPMQIHMSETRGGFASADLHDLVYCDDTCDAHRDRRRHVSAAATGAEGSWSERRGRGERELSRVAAFKLKS